MELDELKQIWKKSTPEFKKKGADELAHMMRGTSRSIVEKLKRSVWFELICTVVGGCILLAYALTLPNGAFKSVTVSLLILFVAYSFYYVKKLLLLRRFNLADHNVKANLEQLIQSLSSYLKFYKGSYTILYPVYFCLSVLFGGLETGKERFLEILSKPTTIVSLMLMAILSVLLGTLFARWYMKKLYGNHLTNLKEVLRDLNAQETLA